MGIASKDGLAQFIPGIHQVSVSLSDNQYGIPFVRLAPLHPGAEIGLTFLENEKGRNKQMVNGQVGFIQHGLLTNAAYLRLAYQFEANIKQTIGLNVNFASGYIHGFYPGDGYHFDEQSGTYTPTQIHQGFFLTSLGMGLSYLRPTKVKPFIRYELNLLNFDSQNLISSLHLGIAIHLKKKAK